MVRATSWLSESRGIGFYMFMLNIVQVKCYIVLALIEQQFRRNQQDCQRRLSAFSRKSKHDLQVGDLVLEIDDNPGTAWNATVRGPYKILRDLHEGAVAVLVTGATQFKPRVTFHRHVCRLAKYFTKYT
jgi:hypothetical protein